MSPDRRQFLQTTAALLAAGWTGPVAQAVAIPAGAQMCSVSGWSGHWYLAPWTDLSLSVGSLAYDEVDLDLPGLDRLHLRLGLPCVEELEARRDIDLGFLEYREGLPLLDARLASGEAMFMLPGELTWLSKRWHKQHHCYEEWVVRGLLGSFLHPFPRCMDFADYREWLFALPGQERLTVGAMQTGPSVRAAALDAFLDAERTLSRYGFRTAAVYATYHGPMRVSRLAELGEVLTHHTDRLLIGNDWIETSRVPFVSVFVSGTRSVEC